MIFKQILIKLFEFNLKVSSFLLGLGYAGYSIKREVKYSSNLLNKIVQNKALIIFDIGSNMGEYSYLLNTKLKNNAIFYLFEPNPLIFKKLESKNSKNNFYLFNFGLGIKSEKTYLFVPKDPKLASFYDREIFTSKNMSTKKIISQVVSVKNFLRQSKLIPNLIKIDTEGMEFPIIMGFDKIISKVQYIQFEFGGTSIDSGYRFIQIFKYLSEKKFSIYRISLIGLVEIKSASSVEEILFPANYIAINLRFINGIK